MLDPYRRTGADPPFGDPARPHGTAFEGWFWRLTTPAGRVLVVLHGVSRDAHGATWGTHGLATQGATRTLRTDATAPPADPERRVHARLADDAWVDATIERPHAFGRRAFGGLGVAQVVPGLNQYWHPLLLGGRVRGSARVGDERLDLDGAQSYAEKNWGPGGFPDVWWWGQAQGFDDEDVCVCFAGGRAGVGPLRAPATALVVRVGDRVVRVAHPLARLRVDVGEHGWRLRGGGVELEGHANGTRPALLPVPVPAERRHVEGAAAQHLAGHMRLGVRRRGRVLFDGESAVAGLERGDARERL